MSEPTKGQIEEAREMVPIFDGYLSAVNGCPHISVHGLARLIAHIRKKARDDALEGAAKQCDDLNVKCCGNNTFGCCGQPNEWEGWDPIYGEMIRALKDQPTGEPQ